MESLLLRNIWYEVFYNSIEAPIKKRQDVGMFQNIWDSLKVQNNILEYIFALLLDFEPALKLNNYTLGCP